MGMVHLWVSGACMHTIVPCPSVNIPADLHMHMSAPHPLCGWVWVGDLSLQPNSAKSMDRHQATDWGLGTPDINDADTVFLASEYVK